MRKRWTAQAERLFGVASIALVVIGLTMSATASDSGGSSGVPATKIWNCSTTNCGSAGNGKCASDEARCCCSNGANPPVYTASRIAGGDCGGSSLCELCS